MKADPDKNPFTLPVCLAAAQALAQTVASLAGTLGLFPGPNGQVEHDTSAAHTSPIGPLLIVADYSHSQAVASLGEFPAPVLVPQPTPQAPGVEVIPVLNPDGTVAFASEQSLDDAGTAGNAAIPLLLAPGQEVAFFAGPPGTPGVLVVGANPSPAALQFGQTLAFLSNALPGIGDLQAQVLAALLSTPQAAALADPRAQGTIAMGQGVYPTYVWRQVVSWLQDRMRRGQRLDAIFATTVTSIMPITPANARGFVTSFSRLRGEPRRAP